MPKIKHFAVNTLLATLIAAILLVAAAPVAAKADFDSEVLNAYMYYFAPKDSSDRAAARAAFSGTKPMLSATMANLQVVRNWDNLSEATRAKLAPYIDIADNNDGSKRVTYAASSTCASILATDPNTVLTTSSHFTIHYTTSGSEAATSNYINNLKTEIESIWDHEVNTLGLPTPPLEGTNGKIDVYVCDLISHESGALAVTYTQNEYPTTNKSSSYIELDNDYVGSFSLPDGVTALQYAYLTFAHEFFHVIQFGINYISPSYWIMEASATWIEDIVYPATNAYLTDYVDTRFVCLDTPIDSYSSSNCGGVDAYGASIFQRYLTDHISSTMVVDEWLRIASRCTCGVSSASTYESYCITGNRVDAWCSTYSTQMPLIETLAGEKSTTVSAIYRDFNIANYTKDYTDGTNAHFPTPSYTSVTANSNLASADQTVASAVGLRHLSGKFYRIAAPSTLPSNGISVSFEGATTGTWQVGIVKELTTGSYSTTSITINSSTGKGSLLLTGFGSTYNNVVVIVNNTEYSTNYSNISSFANSSSFNFNTETGDTFTLKLTAGASGTSVVSSPQTALPTTKTVTASSSTFTPIHAFTFYHTSAGTITSMKYNLPTLSGLTTLSKTWRLYRDLDGDSVVDSTDTLVGTTTSTTATSITFSSLSQSISASTPANYLVVVSVTPSASKAAAAIVSPPGTSGRSGTPLSPFASLFAALAVIGIVATVAISRKTAPRALPASLSVALLLAAVIFIVTGCGGGGSTLTTTPTTPTTSTTIQLSIRAADITYSAASLTDTTAVTGTTLTVTQ